MQQTKKTRMSLTPLIKARLESSLETEEPSHFWLPSEEFDLADFEERIASKLHLEGLKISTSKPKKRGREKLLEGLGKTPLIYRLQMSSFEEVPFIAAAQGDVDEMLSWFVEEGDYSLGSEQEGFQEAIFQFVLAQAIQEFEATHFLVDTKIRLEEEPLVEQDCSIIDFFAEYRERTIQLRLLCPLSFVSSLEKSKQPTKLSLDQLAETKDIPLTASFILGKVQLKQQEWSSIKVGDWVQLDQCSYRPEEKKGLFILSVLDIPIFHAKLKDGRLKLIDYALELAGESMDNQDYEPPHEPQPPSSEEPLNEENFEKEGEPFEQGEEHLDVEASQIPQPTLESLEKASLEVRVEAGRLNISLKQLLSLQPGSVLETSIQPDSGVTLSVGQTPIARGELVELGDFLGVRITEIGSK